LQRAEAEKVLLALQEQPDTWMKVGQILEQSRDQNTKFFALQTLESAIRVRWGALPEDQREGIKTYLSDMIIKLCADEATFAANQTYLNKLNLALVAVLKHDWPGKWRSFVPDIVGASRSSEVLCQNTMVILRLLSEEIFDFSQGALTQAKAKELKGSLTEEFRLIHELCLFVFGASKKPSLINETLRTLNAFLSWIPLGYIFESNLVETLLRLFAEPVFRNNALRCLGEIGALTVGGELSSHFLKLYSIFMQQLSTVIPAGADIPAAYESGSDEEQEFVSLLAIFFTGFFKAHLKELEASGDLLPVTQQGLSLLIDISYVDDFELFKTCMDYWAYFVCAVFSSDGALMAPTANPFSVFGNTNGGAPPGATPKQIHAELLSKLRLLMICKMAKPEEVICVQDENGNIVRETMKDSSVLTLYKGMRETLVYLSHLDHDDTERQMTKKLSMQLNGREWDGKDCDWSRLNTLCWAIGSISGSMAEQQENRFLITVIRDLLNLCEITYGKENKAIIATNIMYVVAQYPRFLKQHWKFLITVVKKVFEFMHEKFRGVQDMACDTFLKICTKCRRKFVCLQVGESVPFIVELLQGLSSIISDLSHQQIAVFYEAVGLIIGSEGDPQRREEYLQKLMTPPNDRWRQLLQDARASDCLRDPENMKMIAHILQANASVCYSLGLPFANQMSLIFEDVLGAYRMYSELISAAIAQGDQHASRSSTVMAMRSVKKNVLKLIETFVQHQNENDASILKSMLPSMRDPILGDYARSVADARDAEVLSLYAAIVTKVGSVLEPEVPVIFEGTFECTLNMITKNFEDFPDHRLKFFSLLAATAECCFGAICALNSTQLKLMIDSVVWAFRHTERNVADTGLNLLLSLLQAFSTSAVADPFYSTFLLTIFQEVLAVMTDTYHKPGFKLHTLILQHLLSVGCEPGLLKVPLWDVAQLGPQAYASNEAFLQVSVSELLHKSFPNIQQVQLQAIVTGMFQLRGENNHQAFKNHLRDFLVQTKGFASERNAELYAEETAARLAEDKAKKEQIPGMLAPNDA
jgi:exportin-1